MELNKGVTLPNGKDATYNSGLSPFFLNRTGDLMIWNVRSNGRGTIHYSWTANNGKQGGGSASYVGFGSGNDISPSSRDTASFAMTLRCLVSTTNS